MISGSIDGFISAVVPNQTRTRALSLLKYRRKFAWGSRVTRGYYTFAAVLAGETAFPGAIENSTNLWR